jgi:UrcA family protein
MKHILSVTALASFAIAGLLAAGTPARAAEASTLTQQVKVGDLDLTSAAGRQELRARVLSASLNVCSPGAYGQAGYDDFMRCVREARQDAMAKAQQMIEAQSTPAATRVASGR